LRLSRDDEDQKGGHTGKKKKATQKCGKKEKRIRQGKQQQKGGNCDSGMQTDKNHHGGDHVSKQIVSTRHDSSGEHSK